MNLHLTPTDDLTALARFLKALFFALLGSVLLYWIVLGVLTSGAEPRDVGPLKPGLASLALGLAVAAVYMKRRRIAPLLSPDRPADLRQTIPRLRLYYIVCYALAESVALMGFALGFIGVPKADAFPFFLASVTIFVLCYPRMPPGR